MPGPFGNKSFAKPKDTKKTALRVLGYLSKSKLPLIAVFTFLLLSVGANIGGAYYMRPLINDLVGGVFHGPGDLLLALVPLLGIYLVGIVASYAQSAIMAILAQRGAKRLREDLFDALQRMPISYYDHHTHGELMSRFTNDADNVQMALEQSVVSLASSALMFVGVVAVMIFISPILFLITLLVLVATFAVIKFMGNRSQKYHREQQAALGRVNGNIQEMIEGLKVVKAFTHEAEAKAQFARLNEEYRQAATSARFYAMAVMPIAGNLNHVGYAITAAVGGLLAIFGGFDIGAVAVTQLGSACAAGTAEKVAEVEKAIHDGTLQVFDTSKFTISTKCTDGSYRTDGNGKVLVACATDTDSNFANDTDNAIIDGAYQESYTQSAPSFVLRIDGIKELNANS